jgi:hypothetical protein
MRRAGDTLLDMEPLLEELIDDHDLQWGDVLTLVHGWLMIHRPGAQEEYTDGTKPTFHYGPK